ASDPRHGFGHADVDGERAGSAGFAPARAGDRGRRGVAARLGVGHDGLHLHAVRGNVRLANACFAVHVADVHRHGDADAGAACGTAAQAVGAFGRLGFAQIHAIGVSKCVVLVLVQRDLVVVDVVYAHEILHAIVQSDGGIAVPVFAFVDD